MILFAARPLWRARGPRFVILLALGWIIVRTAAHWPDSVLVMPIHAPPAYSPLLSVPEKRDSVALVVPVRRGPTRPIRRNPQELRKMAASVPFDLGHASVSAPLPSESVWTGMDRHRWRYSMLAAMMPTGSPVTGALSLGIRPLRFPVGAVAPPPPPPAWPAPVAKRWSLTAYTYWRGPIDAAPSLVGNRPAMLGGSQSAVRIDYALLPSSRLRTFARFTAAPNGKGQADLAIGLTARPFRAVAVDLHVEQRMPIVGPGRLRTLAYVSGGVDDRPLAHGFQLSAYAQGGVAGPDRIAAFVDGAVVVQRSLFEQSGMRLSVGGMVAGAAQPGAARIDVGPRATLHFAKLGQGANIALDWRERIAGDALPDSGMALTLAAEF